jgi:hypothetical protein
MMLAAPTLCRVIASAWRPGAQARVLGMLAAMSAVPDAPVADNAAARKDGPRDLVRGTSSPKRANPLGRTGGIAIAGVLPRVPLLARERA